MQDLILLHGAIGSADQLEPLANALSANYRVHVLNFAGHGGRGYGEGGFSMKLFAENVLEYMDEQRLGTANIFGYSMGGYVGMYLARHHVERIGKVVTLATKYHWDEAVAAKEVQMLNAEKIELKLPAFAATLSTRHQPNDWKEVLQLTAGMLTALGANNTLKPEDHVQITTPVMVLLGDKDKMVSLDETVAVYKVLPNACMGVLPNTQHPIEQVDVELLALLITRFVA